MTGMLCQICCKPNHIAEPYHIGISCCFHPCHTLLPLGQKRVIRPPTSYQHEGRGVGLAMTNRPPRSSQCFGATERITANIVQHRYTTAQTRPTATLSKDRDVYTDYRLVADRNGSRIGQHTRLRAIRRLVPSGLQVREPTSPPGHSQPQHSRLPVRKGSRRSRSQRVEQDRPPAPAVHCKYHARCRNYRRPQRRTTLRSGRRGCSCRGDARVKHQRIRAGLTRYLGGHRNPHVAGHRGENQSIGETCADRRVGGLQAVSSSRGVVERGSGDRGHIPTRRD